MFWAGAATVTYHHLVFPWLLERMAKLPIDSDVAPPLSIDTPDLPSVAVVIPAFNEAGFLAEKLKNLDELEYPRDRLRVVLICDGCTDGTDRIAQEALGEATLDNLVVDLHVFASNSGKVAQLNTFIETVGEDLVVLSDVSAIVPKDALLRVAAHMAEPDVGVVCGGYQLADPGSDGEALYWKYQTRIKQAEAALAAPIGAHGAFYAIRRNLWSPLEPDTINDDFILPMRIVGAGYRGVYDPAIEAKELERAKTVQDFRRRIRIGAGNTQQMLRLAKLADPRRPALAFLFVSGKGLRAAVPFMLLLVFLSSVVLAVSGSNLYLAALLAQVAIYALVPLKLLVPKLRLPRVIDGLSYLATAQVASLIGGLRYLTGLEKGRWKRAVAGSENGEELRDFIHPVSRIGKRCLDIVIALVAFIPLVVLFPIIALAIRLDSPGPIFYRQFRVGERNERVTKLFELYKFRSMRTDAEAASGPMWAQTDDPRVTRVGRFLRKSRLDELPQCMNVLRGEMSVVGPRPERPSFFSKLETQIPFYVERTFGLRPGITGLAQVSQGYDSSIEDVRSKVMHDHVYAMRLMRPLEWLITDVTIIFRTFTVMVLGKGQ